MKLMEIVKVQYISIHQLIENNRLRFISLLEIQYIGASYRLVKIRVRATIECWVLFFNLTYEGDVLRLIKAQQ